MTIRTRLTWQFTIIVTAIVLLFSVFIYVFYAEFRREEYYSRLEKKALTTARLLIEVKEIDMNLLRIIDNNALNALHNERIMIFNLSNDLIYASTDDLDPLPVSPELLDRIRREKNLEWIHNTNETLGLTYDEGDTHYVVIASAFDIYGRRKLVNLRFILLAGSLVSIVIAFLAGRLFSGQALRPITNINREVSQISGDNLDTRVNTGNGQDEIAQLATNFNKMLDRIAAAFSLQKNFVHNASHELRTPLASIISQIQVSLSKERKEDEYKFLLQSVLEDAQNLTRLSNGLLELAQAEADTMRTRMNPVRIDEVLFSAQREALRSDSNRSIELTFSELPENEEALTVLGHERMLLTLFQNLLDNACKFSDDHKAAVSIAFANGFVKVAVSDNGIGISEEEVGRIFVPFFRSEPARQFKGHGLGLSICKKIAELHGGSIQVQSTLGKGSTFQVSLPHN
ncbi:sensor histidine kinase [Cesiribacter andamanensis]|uniref:histidine kinase n=1 Tax=Cesiribacter andamanensis AMV16 TaxID=1279009 RepID=M7N9F4_9BACT|nr:ATP-binding protein [Cesiribacter andamanensis]EMR03892.1 Sensor kinase CusS [Cesiribacter andamanensis AMV16]